jgi:hypothetical protein
MLIADHLRWQAGCTNPACVHFQGWDSPLVVPLRTTYDDWKGHPGMNMFGSHSFFPHMSNEWEGLVTLKRQQLPVELSEGVVCLREEEAFCVDGDAGTMKLVAAVPVEAEALSQ